MSEHEWHTEELVPACPCTEFVPYGVFDIPIGEMRLLKCSNDNCEGSDHVYRRSHHEFLRGLAASIAHLAEQQGIIVPAYEWVRPTE